MRPRFQLVLLACMLSACLPTNAAAEPITAHYSVQLVDTVINRVLVPTDEQFSLTLTFDPAFPYSPESPYGHVRFSPIPLGPLPPPSTVFSDIPASHSADLFLDRYRYFASAAQIETGNLVVNGQDASFWGETRLGGSATDLLAPVTISPETFPQHLSSSGTLNFSYTACVDVAHSEGPCTGSTSSGSIVRGYRGIATLQSVDSPTVTPEPATVLLFGGGLGLLGWRQRIASSSKRRLRRL